MISKKYNNYNTYNYYKIIAIFFPICFLRTHIEFQTRWFTLSEIKKKRIMCYFREENFGVYGI